jgi:hypothetical protein
MSFWRRLFGFGEASSSRPTVDASVRPTQLETRPEKYVPLVGEREYQETLTELSDLFEVIERTERNFTVKILPPNNSGDARQSIAILTEGDAIVGFLSSPQTAKYSTALRQHAKPLLCEARLVGAAPSMGVELDPRPLTALLDSMVSAAAPQEASARPTAPAVQSGTVNLGDGVGFEMGIVGESYYGLEIKRIAGDRLSRGEDVVFTATLRREPDNEYDANAVAVIGSFGKKIGHLSRDYALEYQPLLQVLETRGLTATCSAKMFGGRGRKQNIGVWLDIETVEVLLARFAVSDATAPF